MLFLWKWLVTKPYLTFPSISAKVRTIRINLEKTHILCYVDHLQMRCAFRTCEWPAVMHTDIVQYFV